MSRTPRLKVYRTPIGFHDAYVAAPSQKAALKAWGTERNLFARGVAEEVSDPALIADALASPGTVIRRARGTAEEQVAAAHPPDRRVRSKREQPARRMPRPDRQALDDAVAALAEADRQFDRVTRQLDDEAARLERRRAAAERDHRRDRKRLEDACGRADRAYRLALAAWHEDEA